MLGDGLRALQGDALTAFFISISKLGDTSTFMAVFFLAAAYFFLRYRNKWQVFLLFVSLLGAWLLNSLVKWLIQRPRPELEYLIEASGYSFPSGNAMVSIAFYGMIAYLLWRHRGNHLLATLLPIAIGLIILLIGLARIYLGVHYPSDIVAGFALGGAWLLTAILLFDSAKDKQEQYLHWERYM